MVVYMHKIGYTTTNTIELSAQLDAFDNSRNDAKH